MSNFKHRVKFSDTNSYNFVVDSNKYQQAKQPTNKSHLHYNDKNFSKVKIANDFVNTTTSSSSSTVSSSPTKKQQQQEIKINFIQKPNQQIKELKSSNSTSSSNSSGSSSSGSSGTSDFVISGFIPLQKPKRATIESSPIKQFKTTSNTKCKSNPLNESKIYNKKDYVEIPVIVQNTHQNINNNNKQQQFRSPIIIPVEHSVSIPVIYETSSNHNC